jgi:hypothetical protein
VLTGRQTHNGDATRCLSSNLHDWILTSDIHGLSRNETLVQRNFLPSFYYSEDRVLGEADQMPEGRLLLQASRLLPSPTWPVGKFPE